MVAPYNYVIATGLIVPDTSAILAQVQAEWISAFGTDLVLDPSTPQGVMIAAETLARTNFINNNAVVANQINPNYAGGTFLDAVLALTGIQRTAATQTTVNAVTVTGVAGTTIPGGSLAKTSVGDQFQTVGDVTLPVGGTTTVNFIAVEFGPIPCAAHALSTIVTGIIGWETVDNTNAGLVGTLTQSDSSARAFRNNTLAFQGVSLVEAITSALYATDGVKSLFFQENVAATTQTINGIVMVSHSVYACVDGGTDVNVAAALLENKSSGAAWNGGTTVSVVEPASGQTYAVKFDRPTPIGILVNITVANATVAATQQAILDYANGLINGLQGFVVGADVSPFELSGAVMAENPGAYVSLVEISLTSPVSFSTDPIVIGVDEIATTQVSYITVTLA